MPVNLIKGIDEEVLLGSIYGYISNELHLKIAGAHKKIRAAKSDQLDQQYLGVTQQILCLKSSRLLI